MTQSEVVISGFGGQGALFAGQVLAEAAMRDDLHVTWLPSYGPEMRGGTANVTVIVSEDPIGSPIVQNPRVLIALNKPSVTKYEGLVRKGGLLLVNSSLVPELPAREDLEIVAVPATETAEAIGSTKLANIVVLGALLARLPLVKLETLRGALAEKVKKVAPDLVQMNLEALERGVEIGKVPTPTGT
jgi:2-oxoglutarate ferredoxin oxidoreductase subunit gamma